jgi:hypothetical protein
VDLRRTQALRGPQCYRIGKGRRNLGIV